MRSPTTPCPRSNLLLAISLVACEACGTQGSDPGEASAPDASGGSESGLGTESESGSGLDSEPEVAFADLNGVMWIYTTVNDVRFADLEADLDLWKSRGIRTLGIYSPYHGDKAQWLGAGPRDFYAVPPQNGTLEDFRSLVASAHRKDMKVVAFAGFHSIDESSEFFATAQTQYRAGDRTSHEVASFHWTDDPKAPTPAPAPSGPSAWAWSETAGAYYWTLWDNAGLDVALPEAAAEIDKAITFWMDAGLDGFMLDSGVVHPDFVPLWVDLPLSHKRDLWLTFESTWSEDETSFDEFGLTAWFAFEDNDYANTYSLVVFPEDGETMIDADELDETLGHVDFARRRGKLTHAWSLLEREYPDDRMRVQEAALLAGAGVMYGAPSDADGYATWPDTVRANWSRVLVAVNDNPALHPAASRTRVSAGAESRAYAMTRTATDGSQTVLLAYNFEADPVTVNLELAGTGIATDQQPVDLLGDAAVPAIGGDAYSLALPGYGFVFLDVSAHE